MENRHLHVSGVGIAQCFLSLFVVYLMFYAEIKVINPALYGTAFGAALGITLDWLMHPVDWRRDISAFSRMLVIFIIYAGISGIIVSKYQDYFLSSMITLIAFSAMCMFVDYVSSRKGSIDWLLNLLRISALLCAFYALFFGIQVRTEGVWVLVMAPNNNPNALGLAMVIGIFATVYNQERMEKHLLLNFCEIGAMLYVIVECGSRKSLICGGLLLLMWIYTFLKSEKGMTLRTIATWLLLLVSIIGVLYYLRTSYLDSSSFRKLMHTAENGQGATSRIRMFNAAMELFWEHPLFGIGYKQYALVSEFGKYSHMTYAELLSCTGIIGTIIFLYPIGRLLVQLCKLNLTKGTYERRMLLAMLVIELFLGIGMIFMYTIGHMLTLTVLFWLTKKEKEIETQENCYEY